MWSCVRIPPMHIFAHFPLNSTHARVQQPPSLVGSGFILRFNGVFSLKPGGLTGLLLGRLHAGLFTWTGPVGALVPVFPPSDRWSSQVLITRILRIVETVWLNSSSRRHGARARPVPNRSYIYLFIYLLYTKVH